MSSLANIGPAELYRQPKGARDRWASWLPLPFSQRRGGDGVGVVESKAAENKEIDSPEKQGPSASVVEVPVLALSYWVDGEPR